MQAYEDAPMYEYADKQVSVDGNIDFLNVSNTLVVNRMNDINQGVKSYQRIGNTVVMKRFRIRAMLYSPNATDYLRLLVIYSTSPVTVGTGASTGALYVITMGSYAPGTQGYKAVLSWRLRYKDT